MPFRHLLTQFGAARAVRSSSALALVAIGAFYFVEPSDDDAHNARRCMMGLLLILLGYLAHPGSRGQPGVPRTQQRSLLVGMRDDLFGDPASRRLTLASSALLGLNAQLALPRWGNQEALGYLASGFGLLPYAMQRATGRSLLFHFSDQEMDAWNLGVHGLNHLHALLFWLSANQAGRYGVMLLRWYAMGAGAAAFRAGPGDRGWVEGGVHEVMPGALLMFLQGFFVAFDQLAAAMSSSVLHYLGATGELGRAEQAGIHGFRMMMRFCLTDLILDGWRVSGGLRFLFLHIGINETVNVIRERLWLPREEAFPLGLSSWPYRHGAMPAAVPRYALRDLKAGRHMVPAVRGPVAPLVLREDEAPFAPGSRPSLAPPSLPALPLPPPGPAIQPYRVVLAGFEAEAAEQIFSLGAIRLRGGYPAPGLRSWFLQPLVPRGAELVPAVIGPATPNCFYWRGPYENPFLRGDFAFFRHEHRRAATPPPPPVLHLAPSARMLFREAAESDDEGWDSPQGSRAPSPLPPWPPLPTHPGSALSPPTSPPLSPISTGSGHSVHTPWPGTPPSPTSPFTPSSRSRSPSPLRYSPGPENKETDGTW